MKDIMKKLAELEATAPKVTKKKMLNEDSTTPPMNVSNKPASLKDMFEMLSENVAPGQKPLPVLDPQKKQAGMGFVTSDNPAVQNMLKNLDPKDVQIVQAPGQQPMNQQQSGQPNQAGATGQPQQGQMQMKEKDEGKPGKNFAKIAKSAGERYGSKAAGERVAGAVRAKLAKQGKLEEVDMGQADKGLSRSTPHRGKYKVVNGSGKTVSTHDSQRDAMQAALKSDDYKVKAIKESQINELSPELLGRAHDKAVDNYFAARDRRQNRGDTTPSKVEKKNDERIGKFAHGERKAIRRDDAKMAQQGDEQLDELSPQTLGSYMGKAGASANQLRDKEVTAGKKAYNSGSKEDFKDYHAAISKASGREAGMQAAASKLTGQKVGDIKAKVPANEGAKVDRMVKHIEKSERKLGKSKDEAEDIAWATANKRGMLDNKNKKKVKEGDIAPTNGIDTKGAGLGAGRSATTLESKSISAAVDKSEKNRQSLIKKAARELNYKTKPTTAEQLVKKYDLFPKDAAAIKKMAKELSAEKVSEGAKPDFLDLDKDGNKKESMKKAAADKKKKKVDESMNHRISAARLEGKSHGLKGHAYHGKAYEDLEEMKAYHEGYKEGLDECYGQGVYETAMPATVPGMASAAMPAMEDEMEEGNAFTAALARTPKGGKFSVGGKTFTDRTGYDAKIDEYAFESLDNQLNALLNEGLSVSVSKGQQNTPDSVTITAQDAEADQLLQLVKHAGLGLFGDDHVEPSSAMSVQPSHGAPDEVGSGGVDIEVVDGSDDMLSLMQKLGGVEAAGSEDYADEEGEEQLHGNHEKDHDEPCNECGGMMEAGHSCGSKEMVDEVESEDQMEFKVAEDNAPDSDEAETSADEDAEAKEDAALAGEEEEEVNESFFEMLQRLDRLAEGSGDKPKHPEHDKKDDKDYDDEEEEDVSESVEEDDEEVTEGLNEWANQTGKGPGKGTDASFEQDIEFMTKMIAGGLNKPKSTGQTTVPVIAGQGERMHDHLGTVEETVDDWVKLAGIK